MRAVSLAVTRFKTSVCVMRAFEWDEDFAPGFVAVREAAYGSTSFREDWDFVVNLYYPSMADLDRKATGI